MISNVLSTLVQILANLPPQGHVHRNFFLPYPKPKKPKKTKKPKTESEKRDPPECMCNDCRLGKVPEASLLDDEEKQQSHEPPGSKGIFKDWQAAQLEGAEGIGLMKIGNAAPSMSECLCMGIEAEIYKKYDNFKPVVCSYEDLQKVFGSPNCREPSVTQCIEQILEMGDYDLLPHKCGVVSSKIAAHKQKKKFSEAPGHRSIYRHQRPSQEYIGMLQNTEGTMTFKCIYTPDASVTETSSSIASKVVGFFLTIVLILATWFGVVLSTVYEKELNANFSYGSSIVLTVIKGVIPTCVKLCIQLENWGNPDTIMKMTLLRVYFLKMSLLAVLIYEAGNTSSNENEYCQEATVGVTFYKLIITNSVSVSATNIVSFWFYWYIAGGSEDKDAKTQYDHDSVSQAYIDLNYNQGLFLIGIIYAPMLPILWVIMNAMELWVLIFCLRWFCRLADRPYETTDQNYTLWYLATTWIICAFPLAQFMTSKPSTNCNLMPRTRCLCGPFDRDLDMRYHAISNYVTSKAHLLSDVYDIILNPLVVYGLVIILAIMLLWVTTMLRQVRQECVRAYVTNLQLRRDKLIASKKFDRIEDELHRQVNELENKIDTHVLRCEK